MSTKKTTRKSPKEVPTINLSTRYTFPTEPQFTPDPERYFNCLPNSKYWYHGPQTNDIIDESAQRRIAIINEIKKIKVPEQRSPEWFEERNGKITASDGGTTCNDNHNEAQYKVVHKKLVRLPFLGGKFCHHGKKYESIATMIYMYRMNVRVHEYGLVAHKVYKFLGASPDGIVDQYKSDGVHTTRLVGRMLEIKCPEVRKINMDTGANILDVCPVYYFNQVQLQLECCDLDECDFWQCDIKEYSSREEFIDDTDPKEPFRSKSTGNEKGVVIILVPFEHVDADKKSKDFDNTLYDDAKFIYPPKIEMTPFENDMWVAEQVSTYHTKPEYKGYVIQRIAFWKLNKARCLTIKRDRKWFADHLPMFQRAWNQITFFRQNKKQCDILLEYIDFIEKQ
jgi:putative phage-type endonuclease